MASAPDADAPVQPLGDEVDEPLAPPPVVAVVVAHDPGPWFETALRALAAQDYPNLSTLVIDAGSAGDDVTVRVAAVLPSAYVRRTEQRGFGPAADEVLDVVEGAAFYAFCHDDVALAPNAVRAMVEEAFRSNAGICTPKLVEWDDTTRLQQVGATVDKFAVASPFVDRGELDQEQHDAVADVFVAPGGCTLVRADLFAVLGGFDRGIDLVGEDLDLSWRAQVAGARVVTVPAAVVRHLQASDRDRPIPEQDERAVRHRVRTMLTCYSRSHLARVLPQAIALAVVEYLYALFTGERAHARNVVRAWRWNAAHLSDIRAARHRLAAVRQLPDSEVRRLQVRGSAQIARTARAQFGGGDSLLSGRRNIAGSVRATALGAPAAVWTAVVLVLLYGSRQLLVGRIPPFADLPLFPHQPWTLFTEWASGWRSAGLGSEAPAPTAFAMLGALGVVFLGAMGTLRRVLLVGLLPVGFVGAWRLPRAAGSPLARLAALVTYVVIPLPYDAIARGRWGGLLLWAAAPWFVHALATRVRTAPFDAARGGRRAVLGLGLVVAVVAAFEPIVLLVVLTIAVGLALGGVVAGQARGATRVVGAALGASAIAVVLHVPWTLDFVLPGSQWAPIGGVQSGSGLDLGHLLRFQTGPLGGGPLGWLFFVVAALPLVIGREWRVTWAVRAWVLALTCWVVAWVGQQPWFGHGVGPPEAFLAPAAVALALSAALGVVAFEVDLPGYRFGWRQAASLAAAAALALGALPVLGAMFDGGWNQPDEGFDRVLAFVADEQPAVGPYRVLWIGDSDVMPPGAWRLQDGVAYATTDNGLPTVENRWAGTSDGATSLLGDALHLAQRRDTGRLGRVLAPMGVRYIVVQTAAAPAGAPSRPLPDAISRSLGEQLDLQQVLADPTVQVYRNIAWAPARTVLGPAAQQASTQSPFFDVVAGVDLTGSPPALVEHTGYARASGPVADGNDVYLSAASSSHWSMAVDGRPAPRTKAFGWANSFAVAKGGHAQLAFDTPVQRYGLLALQVLLWAYAVCRWWRGRKDDTVAAA